ncbi:MAG: TPM domain-containing protein [Gemmatimonadales bacterium]
MKGIGAIAALQLAWVTVLSGQQGGTASVFPAHATGYVTDAAHLLDTGTHDALEARLQHLKDVTGADVAVVILPTIGDYAPADVARDIGRAWKLGDSAAIGDKLRNAGAVVLLVPRTADHKGEIYFSAGQGLEGSLTDARLGSIRDAMLPALSQQNYAAALDLGTSMIADVVARDLGVQDTSLLRARAPPRSVNTFKLVIYAIIFVIWILSIIARSGRGGGGGGGGLGGWLVPYLIGRSFGGGGFGGGGFGGGGGGGGGFGGFGGGGGFSGGGAGGSF